MIVTFCGHASFSKSSEYEQKLMELLEEVVGDAYADMYLGGYGEFDSFAYHVCKKYKESHPNVCLILVTPYLAVKNENNNSKLLQFSYDGTIYPELENKPRKFAIYYRNRWMVDKADFMIAYVRHDWGGAYTMLKYAKRKKKIIYNLAELY